MSLASLAARRVPGAHVEQGGSSMTEKEVPEQVEGEPVTEVQEATQQLTPEEIREAQQEDDQEP
jgi:hypothetical protein